MVKGAAMSANSENGGNASAPTAPETKAMARRRQPQDRMTPSTSEARALARGMTLESARLKETSLVTVESPLPTIARMEAGFDSMRRSGVNVGHASGAGLISRGPPPHASAAQPDPTGDRPG